jgi:multidrug efflux system membrane fusion protein
MPAAKSVIKAVMECEAMLSRKTFLLVGAALLIGSTAGLGAYVLPRWAPSHAAEPQAAPSPVPVTAAQARKGDVPIDPGNIVHPTDPTGLVVLTQLRPIGVIFRLPSTDIPDVQKAIASGEASVEAYDAANKQKLDHGSLMLINNQVDASTGTVQLKASFPNEKKNLWPGAFVNVHLAIKIRDDAVTVPLTAVQQGPTSAFVYVIDPKSHVASARDVEAGQSREGKVLIDRGLSGDETVVTAGQYRLTPGTLVEIVVQKVTTASAGMLP